MEAKRKSYVISLLILTILSLNIFGLSSQCKYENKYFVAGETMEYDLHFKWGLISKKSGKATMKTVNVNHNGESAYKVSLITRSEGSARNLFKMDDTLSCIISKQLVPLAYYKDAHEDGDYTKERMSYSYAGEKTKIKTVRHKNGNFKFDQTIESNGCTYDMLSVVFYARTLDYQNMKKGDRVSVDFVSGKKKLKMQIIHDGTEKLKTDNGKKYDCIKLSLKISDDAFKNSEDAMKVYMTNDLNRMPIRIDSKLKIGNARVILRNYSGNLHPVKNG